MSAPKIYHYDGPTGEYRGYGFADPDPMQKGAWLYPANSTRLAPPATNVEEAAVFASGAWAKVANHRGETWWKDGESFVITGLGDPAEEGLSPDGPPETGDLETAIWEDGGWVVMIDRRGETWWADHNTPVLVDFLGDPSEHDLTPERPLYVEPEPEPVPEWEPANLGEALAFKFARLDAKRRQVEEGGILFGTVPLKTDRQTAAIITAAYVKAKENPAFTIPNWKFADGVFAPLDAATIIAAGDAITAHVQSAFDREAELSAQLLAMSTIAEVMAFDVDQEW